MYSTTYSLFFFSSVLYCSYIVLCYLWYRCIIVVFLLLFPLLYCCYVLLFPSRPGDVVFVVITMTTPCGQRCLWFRQIIWEKICSGRFYSWWQKLLYLLPPSPGNYGMCGSPRGASSWPPCHGGGPPSGPPSFPGPTRRGSLQLWQFLVALLDDPANCGAIAWTGRGMEFKLIEPEEVGLL